MEKESDVSKNFAVFAALTDSIDTLDTYLSVCDCGRHFWVSSVVVTCSVSKPGDGCGGWGNAHAVK